MQNFPSHPIPQANSNIGFVVVLMLSMGMAVVCFFMAMKAWSVEDMISVEEAKEFAGTVKYWSIAFFMFSVAIIFELLRQSSEKKKHKIESWIGLIIFGGGGILLLILPFTLYEIDSLSGLSICLAP